MERIYGARLAVWEALTPAQQQAIDRAVNQAHPELAAKSGSYAYQWARFELMEKPAVGAVALTLSPKERSRLSALEATVERGLTTWWEVGLALVEIRDARLYRATHSTFESYCRERWGFSRQRAHQHIVAGLFAEVCQRTLDKVPPNEHAARAQLEQLTREVLAALPPEEQAAAIREAARRARSNIGPSGKRGQSRYARVEHICSLVARVSGLTKELGGCDAALVHLDRFRTALRSSRAAPSSS
jgi:hypothetical protein